MNRMLFLLLGLVATCASAGSLYSFEKDSVLINALNHIQARYSDLAKLELKPRPLQTSIDKSGHLVVSAIFSYEADNEFGLLFVCAKVDENGGLLKIKRDINARKGIANFPVPESPGCWGKP
ncbi:hypothetical protein [Teredinibacter turnerae]|uniref:hypothetical protein n=1 Tax=Teredinibacter turnerae TaxID=2426 RepID=UPI0030CC1946